MRKSFILLFAVALIPFSNSSAQISNLSLSLLFNETPDSAGVTGTYTLSGTFTLGSRSSSDYVDGGADVRTGSYLGSAPLPDETETLAYRMTLISTPGSQGSFTFFSDGNPVTDGTFSIERLTLSFVGPFLGGSDLRFTASTFYDLPDFQRVEEIFSTPDVSLSYVIDASGSFVVQPISGGEYAGIDLLEDTFIRGFGDPETLTVDVSVVPEPTAFFLLAGLAGLSLAARRRR